MCEKIKSPPPSSDSDSDTQINNSLSTQLQTKSDSPSLSIIAAPQPQPRRRNRTKTRKPKFLSLRLQLSRPPTSSDSNPMTTRHEEAQPETQKGQHQQQQLNLFPLHPEKYLVEDSNVALLFCSDACGATLNGVLKDESESPTTSTTTASTNTMTTTSEEESLSPPSLRCWAFQFGGDYNANLLVKRAMKRRNRETDVEVREEKWVSYSQVVEKKEPVDEVTSYCYCSTSTASEGSDEKTATNTTTFGLSSLNLKLDYDGILTAWSHKGCCSLYVGGEPPHSVPLFHPPPNVLWGNVCKVGERESEMGKEMNEQEMGWKLGKREASLLRYKEKRQSRLFSKQIRYEVRKLNAQKRPRMKGRFVKRN